MSEIVALSFTAPGQVKTRVLNRSIKVILLSSQFMHSSMQFLLYSEWVVVP